MQILIETKAKKHEFYKNLMKMFNLLLEFLFLFSEMNDKNQQILLPYIYKLLALVKHGLDPAQIIIEILEKHKDRHVGQEIIDKIFRILTNDINQFAMQ